MRIEDEIKQSKFRDAYQRAVVNLIYTANWVQNRNQEFFKPFGITAAQFNILRILRGQHPESISATEIKSRMLDKNSDVSRMLVRLIAKGLVLKRVCPKDKRAFDVLITDDGLELLGLIDKHQAQHEQFSSVSEEEATYLSDLLDKCRNGH